MNPRQIESDAATLQLDNSAVDGTFFDLCFIPDPSEARDFNPDQPRDPNGQFASGYAITANNPDGEKGVVGVYASDETHGAVKQALKHIGATSPDGESDIKSHPVQIPADAQPGDKLHVVFSEDAADSSKTTVHGVFSTAAEAKAAATEASQASWAKNGPAWSWSEEQDDAKTGQVYAAWAAAHPDDPDGEGITDSFAKQVLGLGANAKETYPGLADANDYFKSGDEPGAVVSIAAKKLTRSLPLSRSAGEDRREAPGEGSPHD